MKRILPVVASLFFAVPALAAPASYTIDPEHTFPSFEADHMGISKWRGKMNKTAGTLTLDKATGNGSVEVTIDLDSIDFGHDALNTWARGEGFFNVEKFPTATFKGALSGLVPGASAAQAMGELTLRGESRPMLLHIRSFKCIEHPMLKRDYCGADAFATFNRDNFGLDAGKDYGFSMEVSLQIQVEALIDADAVAGAKN